MSMISFTINHKSLLYTKIYLNSDNFYLVFMLVQYLNEVRSSYILINQKQKLRLIFYKQKSCLVNNFLRYKFRYLLTKDPRETSSLEYIIRTN